MKAPLLLQAGDTAFLAIDSFVNGRSCGGLRMAPGLSPEELSLLARAMTLKFGFLGLPQGGAKAGIVFDPEASAAERLERLAAFARDIAPLLKARIYVPTPDMGTSHRDIRAMLEAAGIPILPRELRGTRSAYFTARGVLVAGRQAVAHLGGTWAGSRAVIEGFGKVGSALARLLDESGVKVLAVSTSRGALYRQDGLPVNHLLEAAAAGGSAFVEAFPDADRIPLRRLLEVPCDVLFPCARHHSIDGENAGRIAARAIAPGANCPCTPAAEQALAGRGVLVVPDFVSNCGGVLGGTMEFAGIPAPAIDRFIDQRLGARIAALLGAAQRLGIPVRELATARALERFAQVRLREESPHLATRLLRGGLGLYRRGLLPETLVAVAARRYFDRLLE